MSSWSNQPQPGDEAVNILVLAILFVSAGGGLVCAIVGLIKTAQHQEERSCLVELLGTLGTVATAGLFLIWIILFSTALSYGFK